MKKLLSSFGWYGATYIAPFLLFHTILTFLSTKIFAPQLQYPQTYDVPAVPPTASTASWTSGAIFDASSTFEVVES